MKTKDLKRFHRSLAIDLPFRKWVKETAGMFQRQRHFTQTGSLVPNNVGEACVHWLERKRMTR